LRTWSGEIALNPDREKLASLGLAPGLWMQLLESNPADLSEVEIQGQCYQTAWA
jgi:hypothetical protein